MKQLNEAQIQAKWAPMIEQVTGMKDGEKLGWVSKYAHFHALNEQALGGVSYPYATPYNVPGVGNAVPAQSAAVTGSQFQSPNVKGSGDKWPALLPMALQVATRTVGFDLLNVVPMPGPTGVISYMDYVYAGGKQPYGAPPASNPSNANPANFQGGLATNKYDAPLAFKLAVDASTKAAIVAGGEGHTVTFTDGASNTLTAQYIGKSRIDGYPMFKTGTFNVSGNNLADIFDGSATVTVDGSTSFAVITYPTLVSTLEDQIQGFTGAGVDDNATWSGNWVNGAQIYDPMDRGTGEMKYPNALGLQVFTKFVQVGTFSVSVSVTQEQIQDLNKQWGIDVIAMVENAGINEISQSINKTITSRLFAMGWLNHIRANEAEGINLNITAKATGAGTVTPTYVYPADPATPGYNANAGGILANMPMAQMQFNYGTATTSAFVNQDVAAKQILAQIIGAGNVVMQRGRRGPANFIVTNLKLATVLQTNSQYTFSPIANTFAQGNGALYPLGTVAGMTVYVDPNMLYTDTRVLVGRKGAADEPGVVFCPYLMAESVKLITEGTGAPKVIIKSRYSLVDAGFHPETQYITMYVETNSGTML